MGGGLMQISAYGSQDIALTGNPQISFFKGVYYRYTNFSIETMENLFSTEPGFGRRCEVKINKTGDLLSKMYLSTTLPALNNNGLTNNEGNNTTTPRFEYLGWVNKIGHALIKSAELRIGGEVIDKHYSEWLEIWSSLTRAGGKEEAYHELIGEYSGGPGSNYNTPAHTAAEDNPLGTIQATIGAGTTNVENSGLGKSARSSGLVSKNLLIPLHFWFCRDYGSSLPMIALNHQEVKLTIEFRALDELVKSHNDNVNLNDVNGELPRLTNTSLLVDYIYLDTEERKVFAEKKHEYLIDQLQYDGGGETMNLNGNLFETNLGFSQPVKELFWTITNEDYLVKNKVTGNRLLDTDSSEFLIDPNNNDGTNRDHFARMNEFTSAVLKVNGVNRFTPRNALYFRNLQPLNHHTSVPMFLSNVKKNVKRSKGIYCYSFSLRPEENQPSGSLNFSCLDNSSLHLTFPARQVNHPQMRLKVFALNYNVLKINSGMCGLAYSN